MRTLNRTLIFLGAFLLCFDSYGQFFRNGQNPSGVKWNFVETSSYRVIYPAGADSLARIYAADMEAVRPLVGASTGMLPNSAYKGKMPAVLITGQPKSNGLVVWAPRRVELVTQADQYEPEAYSWEKSLVIHESRHISQMQFSNRGKWKPLSFLTGEALAGGLAGIYGSAMLFEGDAVIAETALTNAGRGRSADFLEYYRVAFGKGDWRNWYRWRFGSLKKYTPDHYAQGYVAFGGTRVLYDEPRLVGNYFDRIVGHWLYFPFNTEFKEMQLASGKNLTQSWQSVAEFFKEGWEANDALRGKFMDAEVVVPTTGIYSYYTGSVLAGDTIYAIRKGKDAPAELVSLGEDGVRRVRAFAGTSSKLVYEPGSRRIYWSEPVPDMRWEQAGSSRVRYMLAGGREQYDLGAKGWFFNPSPRGEVIACGENLQDGGTALTLLDSRDGSRLVSYRAPDGLQVVEPCWVGEELCASAIGEGGFGVYCVKDRALGELLKPGGSHGVKEGVFEELLKPSPVKIKQLRARGNALLFVSDRTTVNELYSLDLSTGAVTQITNTKYGGSEFVFAGDYLYFSSPELEGKPYVRTPVADLPCIAVDFSRRMKQPVAEELAAQEKAFNAPIIDPSTVEVSAPRAYNKLLHSFKFHSWAPIFLDYDEVSKISYSKFTSTISPGATLFFQNDLSSLYGYVGASYSKLSQAWGWSGHLNLTYAGLFPVFQLKAKISGEKALKYRLYRINDAGNSIVSSVKSLDFPDFSATLKSYLPLNFSKGGWSEGLIPQVSYTVSNSLFDESIISVDTRTRNIEGRSINLFMGYTPGYTALIKKLQASVRWYRMQGRTKSLIFPRFGIGAELGTVFRPGLTKVLSPNIYGMAYGYLPGLAPLHGTRFSLNYLHQFGSFFPESMSLCVPLGYTSGVALALGKAYPDQSKACLEYAFPFADMQWSFLEPLTYIRNLEMRLRAEGSLFSGSRGVGSLYSVGGDFSVRMGNLFIATVDVNMGFTYAYLGGSLAPSLLEQGIIDKRHYFGLIFNLDF